MHIKNVYHRDIKSENILIKDGHALIADFGLSVDASDPRDVYYYQGSPYIEATGTPWRLSPEVLKAQIAPTTSVEYRNGDETFRRREVILKVKLAAAADLWSAACVLYQMITSTKAGAFYPGAMIKGNAEKYNEQKSLSNRAKIQLEEIQEFWSQEKKVPNNSQNISDAHELFPSSNPFWDKLLHRKVSIELLQFFRDLFAEDLYTQRLRSYDQITERLSAWLRKSHHSASASAGAFPTQTHKRKHSDSAAVSSKVQKIN